MRTKKYFKLFKDILKERGKYSQGRVYLFWSILVYYLTLGILTINGISKSDIDIENFKIVIDALEYALTLFSGYVLGGKAIEIVKSIKSGLNNSTNEYDEPDDSDNM